MAQPPRTTTTESNEADSKEAESREAESRESESRESESAAIELPATDSPAIESAATQPTATESSAVEAQSYCDVAPGHPFHGPYHDHEYGFPVTDDDVLFERLVLEINQAGLSWLTVLRKRAAFTRAYEDFSIERVARYGTEDRERLLADAGIIRNRLKVDAAIHNARRVLELRAEYGSFKGWLDSHHPLERSEWTKLFRKTFRFTGGEIVGEFLMSTGYLPGAHHEDCPVFRRVLEASPPWAGRNER